MEEQVPASQEAPQPGFSIPGQITPEQLAELKARARELAIQQTLSQQPVMRPQPPQVVYVRRNLTVAELLLVFLLSCGLVTGIQFSWKVLSDFIPNIELKINK